MQFELFDYQREAAVEVAKRLTWGRDDWNERHALSSFALSAITGAGKTVIAAAVIEAMFHGSSDLDVESDTRACFLWVTDDPALNRQTLNKMLDASDLLDPGRLVVLDNDFLDPELKAGRVYFLNIQKLRKGSGLAEGGINLRQYSMWEVIGNTVASPETDLYLVLDEAHRGMKREPDRSTIVQRIIGGQEGILPVPVVWGISATIERFTAAMEGAADRNTYSPVAVDIAKVRASGIVKDQIDLDEPEESESLKATLLREAVDATLDFEQRWAAYATSQHEALVLPILVVQVDDKPSDAQLIQLASTIESQWPGLGPHAMVNVFGEHDDLVIGTRTARWVAPEEIQGEDSIRVVLAKQAISTGWDCPRAEVLYSERAARDATHIAQIIGRMVRSPLAHRIATDDALNSVSCFLPRFNRSALTKITQELTKPGEVGQAAEITINAKLFGRNPVISEAVFATVEALPSLPRPDSLANPLRRAKALANLLTDDEAAPGGALLPDANARLTAALNARLDGLAAEFSTKVLENVGDIESAEIRRTSMTSGGEILGSATRSMNRAVRDIDRDTRRRISSIKEGVGRDYLRYCVERGGDAADILAIRTQVAALLTVDGVASDAESVATKWVQDQFSRFAVEIKNTTGATRDNYLKVKEQTSAPEQMSIELTDTLKAPTKDSNAEEAEPLPTFEGHIYADKDGRFPAKLNDWETEIVLAESGRPSFVGWYRNPQRAVPSSLRIAYKNDSDEWGSLQVDFVVISKRDNETLAASIVDPHGDHLADAKAKLRGLADYAESFGEHFVRIESIAKVHDGRLRVLDLLDAEVRAGIRGFEGGKVTALYESALARDYQ